MIAASSSLVRYFVCVCALRSMQTTTTKPSTTLALDDIQEVTCNSRNHQQVLHRDDNDLCARLDQLHQLHQLLTSDLARLLLKPYKIRVGVRVVPKVDLVNHNHPCVVFREQAVYLDICVWFTSSDTPLELGMPTILSRRTKTIRWLRRRCEIRRWGPHPPPQTTWITQSSRRLRSRRQIHGPLQMVIAVKKLVVETRA